VAFFGNEAGIVHASDYPEHIASKDLIKLAVDNGFAVFDGDELNVISTYGPDSFKDTCHMRTWIGHHILAPSQYSAEYDPDMYYDYLFTPDEKVSAKDIMELARNRFEGTPYCPDETGIPVRVTGVETTGEAHILEIDGRLPAEMSVTRWFCFGPTVYNVFVPVSSGSSEFYEAFEKSGYVYNLDPSVASSLFKMLNTICSEERFSEAASEVNKDIVSVGVREYLGSLEDYYAEVWPQIVERATDLYAESPEEAIDYLNRCSVGMLRDLYGEVKALYEETVMGVASTAKSSAARTTITPMVDVSLFAKRYGWASAVDGNTITLTHGDYKVVITAGAEAFRETGSMVTPDGTKDVKVHRVGDSFRVNVAHLGFITEKGEAVPVDYPANNESSSALVWPIVLVAVIAVLLIAVAGFAYRRKMSG
jgi:hypothetical protein